MLSTALQRASHLPESVCLLKNNTQLVSFNFPLAGHNSHFGTMRGGGVLLLLFTSAVVAISEHF